MTDHRAFITQGLEAARDALADASAMANLHLLPAGLSRSLKRRCMARWRVIATIVRRLIFLMALSIELPMIRHSPDKSGIVMTKSGMVMDGVEDVTASFGPQPRAFALVPHKCGPPPPGGLGAAIVGGGTQKGLDGPVPAAPVIAQFRALLKVLRDPEGHALRLARVLRRWKARGEARPYIMPVRGNHRLRPELGVVSSFLPGLLNASLAQWPLPLPDTS
jgi:hypothetical protein